MLAFAVDPSLPFALTTGAFAFGAILDLAYLVLVIWALVVVLKLPALLERLAAQQQQANQTLREVLAEIRAVTKQ